MPNHIDPNETRVLYSAETDTVTEAVTPSAVTMPTDGAREGERVLHAATSTAQPATGWQPDADDVEYQPMTYTDPGAVTEQFDHLATRDPQEMEAIIGGGHPSGAASAETQVFSPEAAALAGGNETTYRNEVGAVTRVNSTDYDLADTADVKNNPK